MEADNQTSFREVQREEGEMSEPVERPRPRVRKVDRKQMLLRPVDVESLVGSDHEVRAIWSLAGQLDLQLYYDGIKSVEGVAGREAIDPKVLICLWIYSYSEGVSSAREIGRLCETDPAYQWLTGMQEINYHTLADFRVGHQKELDKIFADVLGVLSSEGLMTLQRVMHDGTKIKACAGSDSFRREEKLRVHLEMARKHVEEMGDPRGGDEVTPRRMAAEKRAAREMEEKLNAALKELEKIRETKSGKEAKAGARASETDPEARIMKQGDGGYAPSYNVQISTDAVEKIIVGVDVSQAATDYGELVPALEKVKETTGRVPDQMVVDGGFTSRSNIMELADRGVDMIGSMRDGEVQSVGQLDRRGVAPEFRPEAFSYDEGRDVISQCLDQGQDWFETI